MEFVFSTDASPLSTCPDGFSDKEQYLLTVWPWTSRNQHGLLQQDRAIWRNVSEWYRITYGLHLPAVADCPRDGTTITALHSPDNPLVEGWIVEAMFEEAGLSQL